YESPDGRAGMLVVVKGEIWSLLRKQRDRSPIEPETLVAKPDAPAEQFSNDAELANFFVLLSDRETEVVLLRLESMKYREIADALGISPNSVNRFLARALTKIRNHRLAGAGKRHPGSRTAKGTR